MNRKHVNELLYQALETEIGGVEIYETAVGCAVNEKLKEEWKEYLEQTKNHMRLVREVLESEGLDPDAETPGRRVVRQIGKSLVKSMEMAREEGEPEAAELVAGECIVHAETKDHLNWELIGEVLKTGKRGASDVMKKAHDEIEDEEDEHLYHTMGWTRELWMKSLGLHAILPPPEEKKDVKTMMGAARAKKTRERGGRRSSRATAKSSKRRSSSKRSTTRKPLRKRSRR